MLKKLSIKCARKKFFQWFQLPALFSILEASDHSVVISYEKRLLQNRHAVPYNNCALVLKARSLQKGYFPPPVLDPKAVKNNSSPPHFSFSTSSEARCCLYGGVEGNYSRGGFSCWRCPGGQEGWLMLLCQPFPGGPRLGPRPGPVPAAFPFPVLDSTYQGSFSGQRKPAVAGGTKHKALLISTTRSS